jgi:hypothetical protein
VSSEHVAVRVKSASRDVISNVAFRRSKLSSTLSNEVEARGTSSRDVIPPVVPGAVPRRLLQAKVELNSAIILLTSSSSLLLLSWHTHECTRMGIFRRLKESLSFTEWPVTILTVIIYAVIFASVYVTDEPVEVPLNQQGLNITTAWHDLHQVRISHTQNTLADIGHSDCSPPTSVRRPRQRRRPSLHPVPGPSHRPHPSAHHHRRRYAH